MRLLLLFLPFMAVAACTPKAASTDAASGASSGDKGLTYNPADTTWAEKIQKSDDEWRKLLTDEEFEITRRQGTERPQNG